MMESLGSISVIFLLVLSWLPMSFRLDEEPVLVYLYLFVFLHLITLSLGQVQVRDLALHTMLTKA